MLRKVSIYLTFAALAVACASVANADTFFSGRFDVNGATYGGEDGIGVNRLVPIGGRSFTNAVTMGGFPVTGTPVNAVGVATLSDWNVGAGTTGSIDQNNRVVAVFALQGSFIVGGPNQLIANFEGGRGVVRFYDRGGTGTGLVLDNPQTWFPNFADLDQGVIATFSLDPRPTALAQGSPGGSATDNLTGFTPATINVATAVAGSTSIADGAAAVILGFDGPTPNDALFDYLAAYLENPANPQLLITLTEQILADQESEIENGSGIADLSTIFAEFLGAGAGAYVPAGDTYNPDTLGLTNGDVVQNIIGGRAIPGSSPAVIPEPASMIVWGVLGMAGAGYGAYRRRKTV